MKVMKSEMTAMRNPSMEQLEKVEEPDRLLNPEFWQQQSAAGRMAEAWRLSKVAHQLTDDDEIRMQKQIEKFRLIPYHTSLES